MINQTIFIFIILQFGLSNICTCQSNKTTKEGFYAESADQVKSSTGQIGIYGASENSNGVYGESTLDYGIMGFSLSGKGGIRGLSDSGLGVFGSSESDYGVFGSSGSDYGVYGLSTNYHGAYFAGRLSGNYADIVLGGTNYHFNDDDGVIMSDPDLPGSDIFLVANDAIVLEIGNNPSENASFEIWNTNQFDPILQLTESGNLTIKGTLNQGSDVMRKRNFKAINSAEILDSVESLAITKWQYIDDDVWHLGPMAQDFYKAFQIGTGPTNIASIDMDGIALAAIQALNSEVKSLKKDKEILFDKIGSLEILVQGMIQELEKNKSNIKTQ